MLGSPFQNPTPQDHFELNLPQADKEVHSEIAHPNPPTQQELEFTIPPPKSFMLSARNIGLIAMLALILLTFFAIWYWMKADEANRALPPVTGQIEWRVSGDFTIG